MSGTDTIMSGTDPVTSGKDPVTSRTQPARSSPYLNTKRDLDKIRIHVSRDGASEIYELKNFLIDEAGPSETRIASDYSYDKFYTSVMRDLHFPAKTTLYAMHYTLETLRADVFKALDLLSDTSNTSDKPPPPSSFTIDVEDEPTFIIALTQIQYLEEIQLAVLKDSRVTPTWVLAPDTEGKGSLKPGETPQEPNEQELQPVIPAQQVLESQALGGSPRSRRGSDAEPPREEVKNSQRDDLRKIRNNVINNLDHDFTNVEEDEWTQVCNFFSCDEDDEFIILNDIAVNLLPYQAYAIWRVFKQRAEGIASLVIGDDVGLGKSGMAITIATIWHSMHSMALKVSHEHGRWRAKQRRSRAGARRVEDDEDDEDEESWKHCPPVPEGGRQERGVRCPTQTGRVQCPCVRSSLAFKLIRVAKAADTPTIIVSPPGLIPHWIAETQKWINESSSDDSSSDERPSPMRIRVSHSSIKSAFYRVDDTTIRDMKAAVDPESRKKYNDSTEASQYIVFVSPLGVRSFVERFKELGIFALSAGFVFFDEFQEYSGTSYTTAPFQALEWISSDQGEGDLIHRTMAIGVSASARSDVAYIRPFIKHALMMDPDKHIAGIKEVQNLNQYERTWKFLVDKMDVVPLSGRDIERRRSLFDFLRKLYPIIMVSRLRNDKFRGKQIALVSEIDWRRCILPSGPTAAAIEAAIVQVRSYLTRKYEEEAEEWKRNGKNGRKPSKKAIAERHLQQAADGELQAGGPAFHYLSRGLTFPTVVRLVRNGEVDYSETRAEKVNPIAKRLSPHLLLGRVTYAIRADIEAILQTSPWWKHRDILREESTKFVEIENEIRKLLEIAKLISDDEKMLEMNVGKGPDDDTNIRHAVILADTPLSAFLIYMLVFQLYYETTNLAILYMHKDTSLRNRKEICDYMNKDCYTPEYEEDDLVKVLISTINAAGDGYDFSRANTMILTEVPNSSSRQAQAFGRIERQGQAMEPRKIQLWYDDNLAERIRRARNQNRDGLASMAIGDGEKIDPNGEDVDSNGEDPDYPLAALVNIGSEDDDGNDGGGSTDGGGGGNYSQAESGNMGGKDDDSNVFNDVDNSLAGVLAREVEDGNGGNHQPYKPLWSDRAESSNSSDN